MWHKEVVDPFLDRVTSAAISILIITLLSFHNIFPVFPWHDLTSQIHTRYLRPSLLQVRPGGRTERPWYCSVSSRASLLPQFTLASVTTHLFVSVKTAYAAKWSFIKITVQIKPPPVAADLQHTLKLTCRSWILATDQCWTKTFIIFPHNGQPSDRVVQPCLVLLPLSDQTPPHQSRQSFALNFFRVTSMLLAFMAYQFPQ